MSLLTAFGLFAVSSMLVCYAIVEAIWGVAALGRWRRLRWG